MPIATAVKYSQFLKKLQALEEQMHTVLTTIQEFKEECKQEIYKDTKERLDKINGAAELITRNRILEYLKMHKWITVKDTKTLINCSVSNARTYLNELVDDNVLKRMEKGTIEFNGKMNKGIVYISQQL